jgi:Fe-S cluster assembly protein SufD
MKSSTLSFDALQAFVEKLPDDALAASRQAALQHLSKNGLPTTRDEDWKYTDLSRIIDISNRWLESDTERSSSTGIAAIIASIRSSIDAEWLVISSGHIDETFLGDFKVAGANITRLSASADGMSIDTPLGNLNTALLHDGLRIEIAAEAVITKPIGILVIDDATAAPGVAQARIEIEVAANSKASFVEYHASIGASDHYANSVVNLKVGDNARTDYVRIQDRGSIHDQTSRLSVDLGHSSDFHHCAFDLGGRLIRNDLTIDIGKPGSRSIFDGLYLVGDGQHVDNHTRADHRVGPAESHQEYRGILTGHARGIWNGKAIVHVGADGTDAEQANHNLLLSDKAEVDAKPELEIYADDVKCSHGTTVGQLDETALYYLRTRGLSEHDAKQILTRAFAQAIVNKSPIASLHDALSDKIAQRLSELHGAGE